MRLCILATNENVEAVRARAAENMPTMTQILNFPVSSTGELPATHWFCNFKVSEAMYENLMSLKNLSEMEIHDNSKKFLEERNLKFIKSK